MAAPDAEAVTLSFGTPEGWSWDVAATGLDVRAEGEATRTLLVQPGRRAALGAWGAATCRVPFRASHGAIIEVPVELTGTGQGSFVACEARWLAEDGMENAATLPTTPFLMGKPGRHRLICRMPAPRGHRQLKVRLRFSVGSDVLRIGALRLTPLPDFDQVFKSEPKLNLRRPPRCFATPERIERLQQWVAGGEPGQLGRPHDRLLRPVVGSAKRCVDSAQMTVKGTVVAMPPTKFVDFKGLTRTHVSAEMERRLRALAVTYAVTGERQFGERCREYALALASWPSWPTHRLAFGMAPAYDLAYDLFSEEERGQIREALVRCVMRPLAERFWGRGLTSDHNGTVVPAAAFAAATLAIGGEQPGSATCAAVAEDLLVEFLDRRWNTGDHEGPGYDGYTLSHVVPALEAFRMGLGVDHLDHPYLDECLRMAAAFLSPSRKGVVGFGDVGYTCWEVLAATLAAVKRNPLAGWYASESLAFTRYRALRLLYWDADAPKATESGLPLSVAFPKQGLVALRSDRSERATFMAFISSSCPHGHIHLAQNHFRLFRGDQELACRPGYSSNITGAAGRYARGTHAHNAITVDGAGQTSRRGKLLRAFTSPAVDYVVGDATDAYGTGMLSRCRRHIVFLKPDTFIIIDDLRSAGTARHFEWRYHPEYASSPAEIAIGGEPVGDDKFVGIGAIACTRGSQTATTRFLAPTGVKTTVQKCPFAERQGRELVSTAPAAKEQVFVTMISLGPARPERETRELPFAVPGVLEEAELCGKNHGDALAVSLRGTT
ncbi:heparinase II/III family protein [PVC group bacterium]|nr:heparinase II/III family protein [PVC group bacterium]